MSLAGLLDVLYFQPLLAIYDFVFWGINALVPSLGASLILFGIVLNLALLPIYRRMEHAGRERAAARQAMDAEIARIEAHYKGRERYYYVRTIHRHFRYSPISVVFTSGALYLQMLVFPTVYHYISTLWVLNGARFLAISDLGQPDALLFGTNLLPILMTVLNVGAAIAYSPSKSGRLLALGIAVFFLVLLYGSPSGIVLYWTSNNAFSLVRNLAQRKMVVAIPAGLKRVVSLVAHQE